MPINTSEYPSFELSEFIHESLYEDEPALDPLDDLWSFSDLTSSPADLFNGLYLVDPCDFGGPAKVPATPAPVYNFFPSPSWDLGSSSPSSTSYSTPPLTPDRPLYTLPSSLVPTNCDGLPSWGIFPDSSDSNSSSPTTSNSHLNPAADEAVRAMHFGVSGSDTLATPSPTVSTSELSSSSSPSDGSSDEYTSIEEDDDEYGAGPGSDSDSDMDSEYAPSECASPRLSPASKRRTSLPKSTRPAPSPSRRAKRAPDRPAKRTPTRRTPPHKPAARTLITKSRIRQVPADYPCPPPVDSRCPICGRHQRNARTPDLRRHIDAHYAKARGDWMCCGVPAADALEYGVRSLCGARVWPETGLTMVGGCGQRFARKDAYKRHLRMGGCYGDSTGSWLPGIKRERERQRDCRS